MNSVSCPGSCWLAGAVGKEHRLHAHAHRGGSEVPDIGDHLLRVTSFSCVLCVCVCLGLGGGILRRCFRRECAKPRRHRHWGTGRGVQSVRRPAHSQVVGAAGRRRVSAAATVLAPHPCRPRDQRPRREQAGSGPAAVTAQSSARVSSACHGSGCDRLQRQRRSGEGRRQRVEAHALLFGGIEDANGMKGFAVTVTTPLVSLLPTLPVSSCVAS